MLHSSWTQERSSHDITEQVPTTQSDSRRDKTSQKADKLDTFKTGGYTAAGHRKVQAMTSRSQSRQNRVNRGETRHRKKLINWIHLKNRRLHSCWTQERSSHDITEQVPTTQSDSRRDKTSQKADKLDTLKTGGYTAAGHRKGQAMTSPSKS
ncbi:uncharacterized protein LOC129708597 isoform X2 [Leucoraja erinacea]|uniref:uncharacterized protein LOC129708597 isoform X2 n=1 Tax=Leucoraja erinaceus TaxID=7782 RepID=UPI0024567192|nr:uncharacterized protein LOC129708597 isoform X2 [Leucoraja erinacea]XP_055510405.1 uncharacterized protein LOC129708597 isoform X2 [Leucoraja erinacea]